MYHPLEKMAFHLNKLEFPSNKDACVKFGINWLSGSGERDFFNFVNVFSLSHYYLHLEKGQAFIWTNLNPLCITKDALFSWNWHSSFVEEDENVKIYDNDDGQRTNVWIFLIECRARITFIVIDMHIKTISRPKKLYGAETAPPGSKIPRSATAGELIIWSARHMLQKSTRTYWCHVTLHFFLNWTCIFR